MKKHLTSALFCFLVISSAAITLDSYQNNSRYYSHSKIRFATGIDKSGKPVGVSDKFKLLSSGGFTTTIFLSNDSAFNTSQFIVYVDSTDSYLSFGAFESKYIDITNLRSKTAHFNYTFKKAGKYTLSVYTKELAFVTKGHIEILNPDGKPSVNPLPTDAFFNSQNSTLYYLNSKIIFAEGIDAHGYPEREYKTLDISSGNVATTVIVSNDLPINTQQLMVTIERKDKDGKYQKYENKTYDFKNISDTQYNFKYTFREAGEYRFDIRTKESVWVNMARITVTK